MVKDGSGLVKKHAADLQLPVVQNQSDGTLFGRLPTEIPIAACHLLVSFRAAALGSLYFSFAN